MPSVSVIGRPERRPRTISSMASGKFVLNLLIRRLIIRPITKCGPPTPKKSPSSSDRMIGAPRIVSRIVIAAITPRQIIAYLPRLISLPVCSSRWRRSAGFGISVDA